MQLRLAPGVFYVRTADGIGFRVGDRAFGIRGTRVYDRFTALLPRLSDAVEVSAAIDSFPQEERAAVAKLVAVLREQRVVVPADARGTGASTPGPVPIAMFGTPEAETALTVAARDLGLGEARIVAQPDGVEAALAGVRAVAHVAGSEASACAVNLAARRTGALLAPALIAGGDAWLGPMVGGAEARCWECAWRSVAGGPGSGQALLRPPAAAIVAGRLLFAISRELIGATTHELSGRILRMDLRSLGLRFLDVPPGLDQPGCVACGRLR